MRLTQLLWQRSKYRQENNCSQQFHSPLRSWWMAKRKKKKKSLNSISGTASMNMEILFSKADRRRKQRAAWPEGREIFLFQFRLESWWFPQVNCGLWLPAQSSTVAVHCQFFPLDWMCGCACGKLQPTLGRKSFFCQEKSSSRWKRIAFNRRNTK